jgi:hypothetical protein
MKKIILISAVTLFSTGAYAAGCNDSSLKGKFGYEVSGVNEFPLPPTFITKVTRSTHVVGQAFFDGKGKFDIAGYGSAAGSTAERTGNGTYSVNKDDCIATGTMTWNTGETSNFLIVLDHTDNSDEHSANKAYHASVLVDTDGKTLLGTYPSSASGTLTKFVGKFK